MIRGNLCAGERRETASFSRCPNVLFIKVAVVGIFFLYLINVSCQNTPEKLIQIKEEYALDDKEDTRYYFYFPSDIETDSNGNIYVVDTYNNRIQIFDSSANFLRTIGKSGSGPLGFNKPEDIYIDEKNNKIYIADTRNMRIQICSLEGKFIRSIKLKVIPQRIIFKDSNLYISIFPSFVSSGGKGLIKKLDTNGKVLSEFLTPIRTKEISLYLLYNSILMKKDKKGNLIVARKWGLNQVMIFDIHDKFRREFKVIYKGSKWIKAGIADFPINTDEDIEKIPFIIADLSFDSENNYYFLSGNIEKKQNGTFERRREIYKYNSEGNYLGTIILPTPAKLIHIDKRNNLLIIDDNFILRKYRILNQ